MAQLSDDCFAFGGALLQLDDALKLLAERTAPVTGVETAPLAATADTVKGFFNGQDLSGWEGNTSLWSLVDGQIVGRTTGLKENEFLKSELVFGDFRLRVQVNLVGNKGNSGIQFRSEPIEGGLVRGYQAEVSNDRPDPGIGTGFLYHEGGRGDIARVGQMVVIDAEGTRTVVGKVAEPPPRLRAGGRCRRTYRTGVPHHVRPVGERGIHLRDSCPWLGRRRHGIQVGAGLAPDPDQSGSRHHHCCNRPAHSLLIVMRDESPVAEMTTIDRPCCERTSGDR